MTENVPNPLAGIQEIEPEGTVAPAAEVKPAAKELTGKEGALYETPKDKEEFVDPDKLVEHLDRENAEGHEAADTIAPYELVSDPVHVRLAGEYREDVQQMVKDGGVDAVAAEAVMHYVMGEHADAIAKDSQGALSQGQIPGPDLSSQSQCMTYLQRQFGTMAPEIVRQAQQAFKSLPADVQQYLDWDNGDGQVLTNSPHLLVALSLHNSGYTKMNREQAEKEIATLSAKPKRDALDMAKLKIARHVASRGQSADHAKLTKALAERGAPKVPVSEIDKRIKELRTHPAYFSKDHASHKEVVAQVSELYAQKGDK
jgi:hypothetical protein